MSCDVKQLLVGMAAPPSKHDLPGERRVEALARRDPEAYDIALASGLLTVGVRPVIVASIWRHYGDHYPNYNCGPNKEVYNFAAGSEQPAFRDIASISEKGWKMLDLRLSDLPTRNWANYKL